MEESCDGAIDFLVEEAEEWVIVDYKTAGVYPEGAGLFSWQFASLQEGLILPWHNGKADLTSNIHLNPLRKMFSALKMSF